MNLTIQHLLFINSLYTIKSVKTDEEHNTTTNRY